MTEARIALVTGTSSGMGRHTAVGLARAGWHVVATMRDVTKSDPLLSAAAAAGVSLEVRALDVTDEERVAEVVDAIGTVDVLINNAGRGAVGSLEQLTSQELRDQLEVNFLSVASLTRAVLPRMRHAGAGRIVTVTSVGGAVGQPFADAYCAAKFAVEGLMQSLAPVAARFGITVSIVEPAAVASAFVASAFLVNVDGAKAQQSGGDPYASLLAAYLCRTAGAFDNAQSAEAAADVIVEAATTATPRFRWQTSSGAAAFVGLSLADLDGSAVLGQTATWLD
jgi:NAD(P)-dependent dehydrogenase (short-subunit alcohol dehydrogenase family)